MMPLGSLESSPGDEVPEEIQQQRRMYTKFNNIHPLGPDDYTGLTDVEDSSGDDDVRPYASNAFTYYGDGVGFLREPIFRDKREYSDLERSEEGRDREICSSSLILLPVCFLQ